MTRIMCVIAAFITASAVVQASQCSSGGECTRDDEPPNVASLLQSKLQMNMVEAGDEEKAVLRPACAERKLIINSHVKYGKALDRLVASLKEFKFPLKDCVVFRGGANASDQLGPRIGQDGMTFVDMTLNSFDLNAFAGLSRYNNHSLVCANLYFYIHDSTQIGACFPKVFDEIKVTPTEVITPGTSWFGNQCVFGRSVVDKFGDDFDEPLSKQHAMPIEAGRCSGKACPIAHYAGKHTVISERVRLGEVDVYHTSHPRTVTWYQDWDLYKFFLDRHESRDQGNFTLWPDLSLVAQQKWAPSCKRKHTIGKRSVHLGYA